jgi:phosphohistidine swiveling domain-containing protein
MKLQMDDQNHTDWMVGAGLGEELWASYWDEDIRRASWDELFRVQEEYSRSEVAVLCPGPSATGRVVKGKRGERSAVGAVVLLPNLDPAFLEATLDVAAVITEQGGAVAHLVSVGRERALPIVRVKDALKRYLEGMRVTVDTEQAEVKVLGKDDAGER